MLGPVPSVPAETVTLPPTVPRAVNRPAPVLVRPPGPLTAPKSTVPSPVPLRATFTVAAPLRVAPLNVSPYAWLAGAVAVGATFRVEPAPIVRAPRRIVDVR